MVQPVIVVDVGAAKHGHDSIAILSKMYQPRVIWAFDPHPYLDGPPYFDGVRVIRCREAAWLYKGTVSWQYAGSKSHIGGNREVNCFHLAELIASIKQPIVLKLDVEGAEYEILDDLIEHGVDERLHELWVEWHSPDHGRADLERRLRCPLREWLW